MKPKTAKKRNFNALSVASYRKGWDHAVKLFQEQEAELHKQRFASKFKASIQ